MKVLHLKQGTEEWHNARKGKLCASDAAIYLGISENEKKASLMYRLAAGVEKEISSVKESIFEQGHEVEELARSYIEEKYGISLYQAVCVTDDETCLASLDGLTLDKKTGFECKMHNKADAEIVAGGEVPEKHKPQIAMQFYVVDACEKILFVTQDEEGNFLEVTCKRVDYLPLAEKVLAAFKQFNLERKEYIVPKLPEEITALTKTELPTLELGISGAITINCNVDVVIDAVKAYIESMPTNPATDQEFAEVGEAAKTIKNVEIAFDTISNKIDELAKIDDIKNKLLSCKKEAAKNRLHFEKQFRLGKDAKKNAIIGEAMEGFNNFVAKQNRIDVKPNPPDFEAATKNLRTLKSFTQSVYAELARANTEYLQLLSNEVEIKRKKLLQEIASANDVFVMTIYRKVFGDE